MDQIKNFLNDYLIIRNILFVSVIFIISFIKKEISKYINHLYNNTFSITSNLIVNIPELLFFEIPGGIIFIGTIASMSIGNIYEPVFVNTLAISIITQITAKGVNIQVRQQLLPYTYNYIPSGASLSYLPRPSFRRHSEPALDTANSGFHPNVGFLDKCLTLITGNAHVIIDRSIRPLQNTPYGIPSARQNISSPYTDRTISTPAPSIPVTRPSIENKYNDSDITHFYP